MRKPLPLLLCVAIGGCTSVGPTAGDEPEAPVVTAARPTENVGDGIAVYLHMLRDLIDVFRNVTAAADASPTTTNRLMLALALATPAHASSNAAQAQVLLSELLAAGDALLLEERVLVLIHLKDVEQRLIFDAEADRLRRAATAATAQRNDRNSQQLAAALEENRQLQLALDEVRAKLDAITNIERSIRERENGPDTQ
jgi:uncharacterized membrane protein